MKWDRGWAYPEADVFMAAEMHDDGSYQAGHLRIALAYVTDWSCALDGGAHVGTWTKPLAARFQRVIACEPSPDTYAALCANVEIFGADRVRCQQVALGEGPGLVHMALEGRAAALQNTGGRYVVEGGTIPRITIDSLDLPTLGFLKLDVEGSEPAALRGARETLARCRPIVLFEQKGFWTRYGEAPDAPQQVLRQAGYRFLERASCDQVWGPA